MNTTTEPLSTLDLNMLIMNLEEANDCECEMNHRLTSCSTAVVARVTGCTHQLNMCQNATDYKTRHMESGATCAACKRPAEVCWSIIPV